MTDSCLPITQKIRMEKIFLFDAINRYLAVHSITHLDLLVPFLLAAYFAFTLEGRLTPLFERIDAAHRYRQLWCRKGQCRVFRSLSQVGAHAQTPRTIRKTLSVVNRTALRVFRIEVRVVVTVDITAVVTAGREINTRRKSTVWIEFRVL